MVVPETETLVLEERSMDSAQVYLLPRDRIQLRNSSSVSQAARALRCGQQKEMVMTQQTHTFEVGKLVTYYWNGWRTGTVEELTDTIARIRPMQAHKRLLTVDINDLRPLKG